MPLAPLSSPSPDPPPPGAARASAQVGTAPPPGDRWVLAAQVLVVIGLIGAAVGWVVLHLTGVVWPMIDLAVYRWGGAQVAAGGDLYGGAWPAASIAGHIGDNLPFTYTPAAALTFVPLSYVPLAVARVGLVVLDIAALGAIVALVLRHLGYEDGAGFRAMVVVLTFAGLATEPVVQTIYLGQVNILLMAICLVDLLRPASRTRGIGIGLAAAIKLTPAIFIPFLLLTRQWRAAAVATSTAAGVTVAGFLLLPSESVEYWFGGLFMDAKRVGSLSYAGNQSLNGLAERLTGTGARESVPWLVLTVAVGLGGSLAAVWLHRHRQHIAAILAMALTGLLVSPVTWSHHWVWVVPAGVLAVDAARRRRRWAVPALVLGAVVFASPGLIWRPPHGEDAELAWGPLQVVAGNLYIWAGLLVLAIAGVLGTAAVRSARAAPAGALRSR